ncbi:MAG: cytochrome b N-terminal domain-containing protein [Nitrospinota bacterium]
MLNWLNVRTGVIDRFKSQLKYPVPEHANIWICFGGLAFFLIVTQVITGLIMIFFYIPLPEKALESVRYICNNIPYGGFIRNMHRWSATLIIFFLFIHIINVITRRAYRNPRELNWLSGVLLILIMFVFSITGIILPWDWRSYWELVVWADWLGTIPVIGEGLKEPFISMFTVGKSFIIHVWVLPLLVMIILRFHIKLARKFGMAEPL